MRSMLPLVPLFAALVVSPASPALGGAEPPRRAHAGRGNGMVTLIHIGDIHGHLVPRPDVSRGASRTAGGLARVATVIERIRHAHPNRTLLVSVGDALQGSAEALFTRGQAVVDVLARIGIDVSVPGNWDFMYGIDRFVEAFVGDGERPPLAPWPAIASNLHYATPDAGMRSPYVDVTGERVLPPYLVREVGAVRVGILGITTRRGPRALGTRATRGFMFTSGAAELPALVARLRRVERVDVVVVASELELANNIRLADATPGIDVILSADMHELTREPVVTRTGTVIVEEGQDGAAVGELTLTVRDGAVARWRWRLHDVTDTVPETPAVASAVARARAPFLRAGPFDPARRNPINGAAIGAPIDRVVGYTAVALHRTGTALRPVPAVLEGSSHDFIADALRAAAGADVALIRGFRFGTQVPPGPITRADLYHFLPIGAQVAVVDGVPGVVILRKLESSLAGAIDPDPRRWTGGWLVGVSGLTLAVDPYARAGARVRDVRVNGVPLDTTGRRRYSVAGLWFASEPHAVSNCEACVTSGAAPRVLGGLHGASADAVDVVAGYLASRRDSTVSPMLGRVRLLRPLPPSPYGFDEIQPLHGAVERPGSAGQTAVPARH